MGLKGRLQGPRVKACGKVELGLPFCWQPIVKAEAAKPVLPARPFENASLYYCVTDLPWQPWRSRVTYGEIEAQEAKGCGVKSWGPKHWSGNVKLDLLVSRAETRAAPGFVAYDLPGVSRSTCELNLSPILPPSLFLQKVGLFPTARTKQDGFTAPPTSED